MSPAKKDAEFLTLEESRLRSWIDSLLEVSSRCSDAEAHIGMTWGLVADRRWEANIPPVQFARRAPTRE